MPAVPRWGLGDVVVGLALFLVSQAVIGLVLGLAVAAWDLKVSAGDPWLLAIAAPSTWVALVGWPWWVSRHKGMGRLSADFGVAIRALDIPLGIAGGLVALGVGAALAFLWTALASSPAPTNTDIISGDPRDVAGLLVALVTVAIGTPIAEELFFRGLVLGAARKAWGTAAGVAVSALVFGAFHMQSDALSWAFVGTVTASYGVVFALLRVATRGRLAAPIVAHMVVNAAAILVVTFG